MKKSLWLVGVIAVALLAGCMNLKKPATEAVSGAEASLAALRDQAAKYVPETLQSVESQLAALRAQLKEGDYEAVMAGAPRITSALADLSEAITKKKAELQAASEQWASLSSDLPQMISAIRSRVEALSKSRKLPRNLDQATFDSAKAGLDSLESSWAGAAGDYSSGKIVEAVSKAKELKEKGAEVMRSLGMTAG